MSRTGLQARIGYAAMAFSAAGIAGFYLSISLLYRYALGPQSSGDEMYGAFVASIWLGAMVAISAGLVGLTLPWLRRKRRSGRAKRTAIASLIVLLASVVFATTGHGLLYDLGFALWLAYVISFTYVRYGIRDRARVSKDGDGRKAAMSDCAD